MARRLRNIQVGGFYHLVNRGIDRCKVYFSDSDYKNFMKLLSIACEKYRVPIVAYALMPNHFHIIIKVFEKSEVSNWAKWFQGVYAQYFNKKYDRVGGLWQDRFYTKEIRNGYQLAKTWMYVEQNPVKAGLIETQSGWKWSSAYLRANQFRPQFLIEPNWWYTDLKQKWWSEELLDDQTLEAVRNSLKSDSLYNEEVVWPE